MDEVLGDMVASGLLRYSLKGGLWVLNESNKHLPEVIKAVSGINGSLPVSYIAAREVEGL